MDSQFGPAELGAILPRCWRDRRPDPAPAVSCDDAAIALDVAFYDRPVPALGPLLERDAELSTLAAAEEEGQRGTGRLVVVEGPAGIGKTRLLRRCVRSRQRGGARSPPRGHGARVPPRVRVVRQLLDPWSSLSPAAERETLFVGAARLSRTVLGGASTESEDAEGPTPTRRSTASSGC